jgi:hypothetical protein
LSRRKSARTSPAQRVGEHAREERAVVAHPARDGSHGLAQAVGRCAVHGDLEREAREHLLVGLLHQGAQERIARLEVVVEHAEVHARGVRHLAHRERGASAVGKEFASRREEGAIEVARGAGHGD